MSRLDKVVAVVDPPTPETEEWFRKGFKMGLELALMMYDTMNDADRLDAFPAAISAAKEEVK